MDTVPGTVAGGPRRAAWRAKTSSRATLRERLQCSAADADNGTGGFVLNAVERVRTPLVRLVPAALALAAFESAFSWSVGSAPAWSYWAFCAAIGVAAATLAALASMPWGRPAEVALAVWTGAHGWLLLAPFPGLVLGVATYGALELARVRLTSESRSGLPVAAALAFGLVFLPRITRMLGGGEELHDLPVELPVAAVLAVLAALLAMGAMARRTRLSLPSPDAIAAVLLPVLAFSPLLFSGTFPERHVPNFERATIPPQLPSLIVLVMDTVRADHLSLYGYQRETTPNLRAFVEHSDRAVVYPLAHAPGTWTLASHASLFTGLIPSEHGVQTRTMFDFSTGHIRNNHLRADRTLAEVLHERGYRTAFVSANSWMRHVRGMERGFDWFLSPIGIRPLFLLGEQVRRTWLPGFFVKEGGGVKRAEEIDTSALAFLHGCAPGPCFLVTNYMEAHAPLMPARGFAGRFVQPDYAIYPGPPTLLRDSPARIAYKMARYDEEILELDAEIGRFLARLQQDGWLDRSWLVITADHGEAFGEKGVTEHGTNVYEGVTHIPLVVQPPRGVHLPLRDDAVSLIDVTATLAAVAGAMPLGDGIDLRTAPMSPRPIQIEFYGDVRKAAAHGPLAAEPARAVVQGDAKLVEVGGRRELYRLRSDPTEQYDRSRDEHDTAAALGTELPILRRVATERGHQHLSPHDEAELRALGYID
jgi:arylsulfatase A-like enzyme